MAKKTKGQKTVVSLEIGANYIKLAESAIIGPKPVLRLLKKEFSQRDDDGISREIRDLFLKHNMVQKNVFLNIPRHLVMARILHLPSVSDDEIGGMVKIELIKQLPHGDEEIIIGYKIIDKRKDGYSDVLLAIAQAKIINRLINISKKANLTVEKIALGSESLFSWYSMSREKTPPATGIALLNIDSEYIYIDIIEKGKLVFTRALSQRAESRDAGIRDAVEEIKKSIAAYRRDRKSDINKICLSGGTDKMKAIEPILKEGVPLPLEQIDQGKNIKIDKSIVGTRLGETSFVELIGLALKSEDIEIDLLPEKIKEENRLRLLKKTGLKTVVLLACIVLVSAGAVAVRTFDKSLYLSKLDSKLKAMEPRVRKAKRMRKDIKIIKTNIWKKPLAIDILSEIYKITPSNITFNLLDYESGESLILKGNASSLDKVVEFIAALENSRYFENAKIKYTTKRSVKGEEKTDFEIMCALSKIG